MLVARRALHHSRSNLRSFVPGDAPLVRTETLAALAQAHRQSGAAATILSAELANPSGYGRILRGEDGSVAAIVEDSALTPEQRTITEINSSIYAFTLAKLWPCLARLKPSNVHRELYLTDAIAMLRQQGELVVAQMAADADEVLGCNTRADLAAVDLVFRRRKRAALMDSGVTIQMPETVLVDPDVTVGADTVLGPGVQLLGRTLRRRRLRQPSRPEASSPIPRWTTGSPSSPIRSSTPVNWPRARRSGRSRICALPCA